MARAARLEEFRRPRGTLIRATTTTTTTTDLVSATATQRLPVNSLKLSLAGSQVVVWSNLWHHQSRDRQQIAGFLKILNHADRHILLFSLWGYQGSSLWNLLLWKLMAYFWFCYQSKRYLGPRLCNEVQGNGISINRGEDFECGRHSILCCQASNPHTVVGSLLWTTFILIQETFVYFYIHILTPGPGNS